MKNNTSIECVVDDRPAYAGWPSAIECLSGKRVKVQAPARRLNDPGAAAPAFKPEPIASRASKEPANLAPLLPPKSRSADAHDVDIIFHLYAREISRHPLITPEQENELAARIRRGDAAARERMITANLRLVVKIAHDFLGFGLPLLDLISEGNIGLMKAVERFNPAKGARLSTYSSYYIKQAMRRAIANHGRTIRLPVHVQEKLQEVGKAELRLQEQLNHEPTEEELARASGMRSGKLARYRAAAQAPLALDQPDSDDAPSPYSTLASEDALPSDQASHAESLALMQAALAMLPEREQQVLRARFGLENGREQTLDTVGTRLKLSRERIRQLEVIALNKLRLCFKRKHAIAA